MRAIAIAILVLLVSCTANTNEILLKQLGMREIVKTRFDIEAFDKHKRKEYENIPSNNDQIYEFMDSAGIYHEQGSTDDVYYEVLTYPDSLVCDAYVFYSSGTIKRFARTLIKGAVDLGNEVHFDEEGNITEVINHDEPYKFTLEQVLAYMKANDIDIWDENVSLARGIGSEYEPFPGEYTWLITIRFWDYAGDGKPTGKKKPKPRFKERSIELDAITGEVLWDKTEVLENF